MDIFDFEVNATGATSGMLKYSFDCEFDVVGLHAACRRHKQRILEKYKRGRMQAGGGLGKPKMRKKTALTLKTQPSNPILNQQQAQVQAQVHVQAQQDLKQQQRSKAEEERSDGEASDGNESSDEDAVNATDAAAAAAEAASAIDGAVAEKDFKFCI